MSNISKLLIGVGIFFVIFGVLFGILQKIGIDRLPGDIRIERHNFSFYFPLASCMLISIVLSLIASFLFRK